MVFKAISFSKLSVLHIPGLPKGATGKQDRRDADIMAMSRSEAVEGLEKVLQGPVDFLGLRGSWEASWLGWSELEFEL